MSEENFDRIATAYDESLPAHVVEHYLAKRTAFIADCCPAGAGLDVGCGTGVLAARLAARGFAMTGLDPSEGMLDVMRAEHPEVAAVRGSGDELPFETASFDLVLTVAALHHIADPAAVRATLAEMVRVCRPGGRIVVWDHNPRNPYWKLLMARVPQDDGSERLDPRVRGAGRTPRSRRAAAVLDAARLRARLRSAGAPVAGEPARGGGRANAAPAPALRAQRRRRHPGRRRSAMSGSTGSYGRSAAGLTVALGIGGVLTYVFFILASRSLGEDQYGEIVVLWSVVFILASTLYRPIEQLLARTLAERDHAGAPTGDALRTAGVIQLGVCLATLLALLALRGPLQDQLFSNDPNLYWAMLVALAGFALAYFARGYLAGKGRFSIYAALLLSEVLLRLVFAILVAIGVLDGAAPIAVGIALAPFCGLLLLPFLVRRDPGAVGTGEVPGGSDLTLGSGGAFAGAVLLMMLSEQVLVSSGALFVRAAEGAAAAGFMFNILLVARAPLVLFQAVAASLLPHLTRQRARADRAGEDAFRDSLHKTMWLIVAFATATTIGVLAIGPQVMQLAFGDNFDYDRVGLAIVAVGMGFYLVAASLNQAALAQGQAHRAAARWVLCAALFVAINVVGTGDPFRAVEIGYATCSALLALLLYAVYRRPEPRAGDLVEPGSPEELQARLATSDEVA